MSIASDGGTVELPSNSPSASPLASRVDECEAEVTDIAGDALSFLCSSKVGAFLLARPRLWLLPALRTEPDEGDKDCLRLNPSRGGARGGDSASLETDFRRRILAALAGSGASASIGEVAVTSFSSSSIASSFATGDGVRRKELDSEGSSATGADSGRFWVGTAVVVEARSTGALDDGNGESPAFSEVERGTVEWDVILLGMEVD